MEFFSDPIVKEVCFYVAAFVFLLISAIYDSHGAMIPDTATIPYAAVGISYCFFQQRYHTLVISVLLLFFTLQPWRPKFLKKINAFFMKRAYKGEEEMAEVSAELLKEAEAFEASFSKRLHFFLIFPLYFIFSLLFLKEFFFLILLVSMLFSIAVNLGAPNGTEEISAMGTADIIVLVGMFAFYGPIGFVYCTGISFVTHIVFVGIKALISKDKGIGGGAPLLPSFLASFPFRIAIFQKIGKPMAELYASIFPFLL